MGRDVLAVAPPGAGKTLAYVLPAAAALVKRHGQGKATRPEGPLCVVLVPTRELAHQVLASWQPCRRVHGLRTVAIFG